MQSLMEMNIKGDSVGIFRKAWNWLFVKREVESYEDIKAKCLKDVPIEYNSGGYVGNNVNYAAPEEFYKDVRREGTKIKGGVNQAPTTPRPTFIPPPQNPTRDFKREADEYFIQQARRDSEDNFLTGAMVGYLFADSLNDNNSHRNVEETKSSNYESSYTPSSYDSGSYSSSSDSGSSSSSCDSGC